MNRLHHSIAWDEGSKLGTSVSGEEADGAESNLQKLSWKSSQHAKSFVHKGPSADWTMDRGAPQIHLLPLHYEPNYQYPLIVWLHNDGFNEHQVEQVMPHVSLRNYVAVGVRGVRAADSVGHRFDWASTSAACKAAHDSVMQSIESACDRFSIHPERIVLAGYRSGGTMALRIAARDPHRFAGVISLGGNMPAEGGILGDLTLLRRRRLPMLWQWSSHREDFEMSRLQKDIRTAMMIRARVDIRQYADDDEMNTVTLSDVNEWIMHRIVGGNMTADLERWQSSPAYFSSN